MATRIHVTGRLTRNLEVKYTQQKNTAYCNCNLASTEGWGENEFTIFYNVTFWGKRAESAAQMLSKGRKISAWCKPSQPPRIYTHNGETRASVDLTIESWEFMDTKPGNENNNIDDSTLEDLRF